MNRSGILIATLLIASAMALILSGVLDSELAPSVATSNRTVSPAPGPAGELPATDPALDPVASGRSEFSDQPGPAPAGRRLVGVIGTDEESERRALIESAQGIQTLYRIGEPVPPDQAILEEVHHNRAMLRRPDDELITLYRQGTGRAEIATIKPDVISGHNLVHDHPQAESTGLADQPADADAEDTVAGQSSQRAVTEEPCDEAATGRESGACEAARKRQEESEKNRLAQAGEVEQPPLPPGDFPGADQDSPGSGSAPDQTSPVAEIGSDQDAERAATANPVYADPAAGPTTSPVPAAEPEWNDGRE